MLKQCAHFSWILSLLYCHVSLPGINWFLRKLCSGTKGWQYGLLRETRERRNTNTARRSNGCFMGEKCRTFLVQTLWCYTWPFIWCLNFNLSFNLWSHECNQGNQKKISFCKMSTQTIWMLDFISYCRKKYKGLMCYSPGSQCKTEGNIFQFSWK